MNAYDKNTKLFQRRPSNFVVGALLVGAIVVLLMFITYGTTSTATCQIMGKGESYFVNKAQSNHIVKTTCGEYGVYRMGKGSSAYDALIVGNTYTITSNGPAGLWNRPTILEWNKVSNG